MQMDNAIVSDSEAKEFYDKNAKKFMQEDSVHARHILVKEEKEAQEIIDTLAPLKDKHFKRSSLNWQKQNLQVLLVQKVEISEISAKDKWFQNSQKQFGHLKLDK